MCIIITDIALITDDKLFSQPEPSSDSAENQVAASRFLYEVFMATICNQASGAEIMNYVSMGNTFKMFTG